MDEFKKYKRGLIQINRDTIILLHIFEKDTEHSFEDIWLEDNEAYDENMYNLRREAAKQFIKQFEGNECGSFIKALRDECDAYLNESEVKKQRITELYENRSNE